MFTGIIEEIGVLEDLSRRKDTYRLKIRTDKKIAPVKNGDSLSVSGVCLTLVDAKGNNLFFDVTEETFRKSAFRYLRHNSVVNIEKALELRSRLDGHFVLGHVDSAQKIKFMQKYHRPYIDVSIGKDDRKYIVKKGSVAIDGISLTVGEDYTNRMRLYIIPYTLANTNLQHKKIGDWVNVEFDILGKYILKSKK